MFTVGELFGDFVDGTFAEGVVMVVFTLDGTVLVFVVSNVEDVVLKISVVKSDVDKTRSVEIMSEEGVDNSDVEKIWSVEIMSEEGVDNSDVEKIISVEGKLSVVAWYNIE